MPDFVLPGSFKLVLVAGRYDPFWLQARRDKNSIQRLPKDAPDIFICPSRRFAGSGVLLYMPLIQIPQGLVQIIAQTNTRF